MVVRRVELHRCCSLAAGMCSAWVRRLRTVPRSLHSRRLTSSADHGEFDRSAGRPHRTGVVALLSGIRRCRSETPNGLLPALGRFNTGSAPSPGQWPRGIGGLSQELVHLGRPGGGVLNEEAVPGVGVDDDPGPGDGPGHLLGVGGRREHIVSPVTYERARHDPTVPGSVGANCQLVTAASWALSTVADGRYRFGYAVRALTNAGPWVASWSGGKRRAMVAFPLSVPPALASAEAVAAVGSMAFPLPEKVALSTRRPTSPRCRTARAWAIIPPMDQPSTAG